MTEYTPDRWVLLRIENENETLYKILGGWMGGYLGSDNWRMNSGISKKDEDENSYTFHGYSGSTYVCYKKSEGFSSLSGEIYSRLREKFSGKVERISVKDYAPVAQSAEAVVSNAAYVSVRI